MIATCQVCGREFIAKRSTAKYCSGACKFKAHRQRSADTRYAGVTGDLSAPSITLSLTRDEVSEIIDRAHISAEDMSRASLATPAPLCHQLGRCAKAFESALRRESL